MKKQNLFKLLIIGFLLLCASAPLRAQTLVTGTVTDPNGIPYSAAQITARLTTPGATVSINNAQQCAQAGYGSAPCQIPIQGTVGPTTLDSMGTFAMALWPNGSITPASTQWVFTVNMSPGIVLPMGTGAQTFTASITISGSSQSISSTLNAAAPNLTNFLGSGGNPPFSAILTGTNTTATMTCGTGCSMLTSGGGTIAATTAAKWATARNLAGNSVDGSANVAFSNKFIVQGTTDAGLSGAQFLGALGTGPLKNTTSTGVLSIAVAADIYGLWSGCGSSTVFLNGAGGCTTPVGTIGGSLAAGQVAYGTGVNTLGGTSELAYNGVGTDFSFIGSGSAKAFLATASGSQVTVYNSPVNGLTAILAGASGSGLEGIGSVLKTEFIHYSATGCTTWGGATSGLAGICPAAVAGTPSLWVFPTTDPTNGQVLTAGTPSGGLLQLSWTTVSGGGGVSSFSSGNLSPLFTTSVATATTTPALSFALSNAAQNSVFAGPASGGAGAPSYQTAPTISAANMTSFPTFNQNTTGSAAKWTTARNLAGNSVDGSANVAFSNKFIVQGTTDAGLSGAQFLGALGTGPLKNTTSTGVLSIAVAADIYGLWSGSCSSSTFLNGAGACATPGGTISGLTTNYMTKAGSSTTVTNSLCDEGVTTASTMTCAEAIATASNGTNPGYIAMVGNTAAPTLITSTFGILGPSSASFTAYALQFSSTAPTTGQCFVIGTVSGGIAPVNYNTCGTGSVTSVAQTFTGGIISVSGSPITSTGTLALTLAGTSGGIPYFSSASTWATSGILNTGFFVKGGGAGSAPTNTLCDEGATTANTITCTDTAGIAAVKYTATGTTAGFIDFPQGSTSSAVAPCNAATSICWQAPTSVTSYLTTLPGAAPNVASYMQTDACGSASCTDSFHPVPQLLTVASDFTTAANTSLQTITGLSLTTPVSKAVVASFHCNYSWSQATGTAAVAFGIQGATTAPTNIEATATSFSNTTAETTGTLTGLNTTTATSVVSVAPSAITTIWKAELDGTLEAPSNASPTVLNFMVSTATSGDAVTLKRGSYCMVIYQ